MVGGSNPPCPTNHNPNCPNPIRSRISTVLCTMAEERTTVRAWALFLAALLLMLFANGRWTFVPAAWVAPLLFVRFVRTAPLSRAWLGGMVVLSIASFVWWRGVFPLHGVAYAVASVVLGFLTFIPYLVDRRYAARLGGMLGTLVLPAAAVSIEALNAVASPFGSWGSYAYAQAGFVPLMQLASVTGLAGITFLVLWFASIVSSGNRRHLIIFASVTAAVLLYGVVRSRGGDEATVRVAAVTPRIPTYTVRGDAANQAVHDVLSAVRSHHPLAPERWAAFRRRARAIDDELLAASDTGANIVVWSEGAGIVAKEDEAALIARAAALARQRGISIELAFLAVGQGSFENRAVLVDAAGKTVWTYDKAHPVPFMESCAPGDGRIPVAPTPFGRLATVICFDGDFPRLVRQAGRAGADILLIPADDWPEIASLHTNMVRFRAIEQGLSIVRATSNGDTTVIDRFGRMRARADYFTGARVLHAEVPRAGRPTPYTRVGDVAGAAAVALLIALIGIAEIRVRPADAVTVASFDGSIGPA